MSENASDASSELSELDSALFSNDSNDSNDSSDPLTSNPAIKRRKLRATSTWEYGREPIGNEAARDSSNRRIFYCKYPGCNFSSVVTTNIRLHLKTRHKVNMDVQDPLVVQAAKKKWESYVKKAEDNKEEMRRTAEEKVLDKAIQLPSVQKTLAELIVVRNLPYNAVTWPELHSLLQAVNYRAVNILPSAPASLKNIVAQQYELNKEALKEKLCGAVSCIHLSLDCWSAPNRKTFLAIVAYFVDDTFISKRALLGLKYLPGKHGADEQIKPLWDCLQEYSILDKIGYIIGDNHGSNDKVIRLLAKHLENAGIPMKYDINEHRIRCHGHIINLAVQAFFFCESKDAVELAYERARSQLEMSGEFSDQELEEALGSLFKKARGKYILRGLGAPGKLHNLVVSIRSSNERYNAFVALAGKMIPMDNDTRWNSWLLMCETAIEPAVMQALNDYQFTHYAEFVAEDLLTPEDWDLLKNIVDYLQPFKRVTKETEGTNATLDRTLYTMDFLVKHYKKSSAKYARNKQLLNCITTSWYVFDKYYAKTDEVAAYGAALLLAPHRRKAYLDRNWQAGWVNNTVAKVQAIWLSFYKDQFGVEAAHRHQAEGTEPDEFDKWDQEQSSLTSAKDEFERFIIADPTTLGPHSTLGWWLLEINRNSFPCLSRMAIDILSIPPMSAEPERIFSGARRTISWDRFRLSPRIIERGECLKSWFKAGLASCNVADLEGGI